MAQDSEKLYDDMRSESYRTLLNSEIQANIAKQNALKYTQNQLNQTGYANQGVAQSTALGIENSYRNALADANNEHLQRMAQYDKDQYDYNQKAWAGNYDNAEELLYNAFKTDDYGNVVDFDENYYKSVLGNYGVTFDGDKSDFSNSKFTDSDRLRAQSSYETTMNTYKNYLADKTDKENTTGNTIGQGNESKDRKVYGNKNGDKVDFLRTNENSFGSYNNANFDLTLSDPSNANNNKTLKLELGRLAIAYGFINNKEAVKQAADKNVGDIWLSPSSDGKKYTLVIKDQKNNVRAVQTRSGETGITKGGQKEAVNTYLILLNRYCSDSGEWKWSARSEGQIVCVSKNGKITNYDLEVNASTGKVVIKKA